MKTEQKANARIILTCVNYYNGSPNGMSWIGPNWGRVTCGVPEGWRTEAAASGDVMRQKPRNKTKQKKTHLFYYG